jgi:hypothetical protein
LNPAVVTVASPTFAEQDMDIMTFHNFVSILVSPERWSVRVVEHGVMIEREFSFETQALAWASGQRIRLNLPNLLAPFPDQMPLV